MEEPVQQQQPVQNIENTQHQAFVFHVHKKLALLIFVSLFFLAFGVGAYYVGKLSTQTPIVPSVIPTVAISSPAPTNNQVPTIIPTNTVTDSTMPPQIDYSCQSDADCVIKDAGSCCGQFPQCMNVNAKPNPDFVKKQCEKNDVSGSCGFPSVDGCKCINNKCAVTFQGKLDL